jgi:hypothetical protein
MINLYLSFPISLARLRFAHNDSFHQRKTCYVAAQRGTIHWRTAVLRKKTWLQLSQSLCESFSIPETNRWTPALRAGRSERLPALLAPERVVINPHDVGSMMHKSAVPTGPGRPRQWMVDLPAQCRNRSSSGAAVLAFNSCARRSRSASPTPFSASMPISVYRRTISARDKPHSGMPSVPLAGF